MIVSILQLMGFPMAKPVHSRAEEPPQKKPSKSHSGTKSPTDHAQERSARRQEVKAKTGKDSQAAVTQSKEPAPAKPAAKPTGEAAFKPAPPKPTSAKPVAKAPKSIAKVVEKPPEKPVAPVKKVSLKAVPANLAKPAAKVAPQPVSKPRAPASPVPMPVSTKSKSAVVVPPVVEKVAPVAVAPVPAKAGRPSSRLAQLTVPSIAQTVASTAAKASYTQSIPSPLIVPAAPSSIKKDAKLANNWKTTPAADLTDAELMAMPDSEYMNNTQLGAFRARLVKLKLDILNSAGETTEHLREDTSVVPDPADRATIEEEHALELRTRDRERKLLKKIEQSIVRIDAGDYGYCDETGEPIGVGRLLARPTATLSLEAQQRRELKQKMFGD
jgi:DnaK suppressor protein